MVGSAILRHLVACGHPESRIVCRTHAELDLTNQADVYTFFAEERPDQVYLAAAKVGGILANNTYPADFIYDNLMIEANVINAAFISGVKKLLFLGSSCIYPKRAKQPIKEDFLLADTLEPTNEPYAIAKIAGIKLCESYNRQFHATHGIDYRSIMPANLYGPGDNFNLEYSHVIPALIRRFHEAKINNLPTVFIWGTGMPKREFLYVDDMAAACVHVMNLDQERLVQYIQPMTSHINVGFGKDITIEALAGIVAEVIGYKGEIRFDATKPDGAPRKLLDSTRLLSLDWIPSTNLRDGLRQTYAYFLNNNSRN